MDDSAVKESRRILRRVQEHLLQAHMLLGASEENIGMVEVISHPQSRIGDLNYVTPRRNTAWVSAAAIEQGLGRLAELNRTARVEYIEGLYPPIFAKSLRDLGLMPEHEMTLMIYPAEGWNGLYPPPPHLPEMPDSVRLDSVDDQRGLELWWYVWRNAAYDVLTLGIEPLAVGRDIALIRMGYQLDIIAYRQSFPIGVVRIGLNSVTKTAHIVALALMREWRTVEMEVVLLGAALKAALDRGCTIVFAPGETDEDRRLCREMGFMDFGSVVCYAARTELLQQEAANDILEQPVLTLR